jgi:beta-glucosidase
LQLRTLLSAALAAALVAIPAAVAVASGGEVPPDALGQQTFLWGVTLSGYQNDGAHPAMDWADLEREGTLPEPSGKSADFRGHMDADLDRAQAMGLNAFRTSIEWARIEPEEGKFDKQEVAYVHRMLQGIRRRGMKPMIALHHFATPRWAVRDDGDGLVGWENPRVVARFGRYVDFVAKEFASEIDWYITFNEPSILIAGGYLLGWTKPHHVGPMATYRATANVLAAHVDAYQRVHKLDPVAQVSIAEYNCLFPVGEASGFLYMPSQLLGFVLDKERRWDGNSRVRHLDYLALHYYGAVDAGAASVFPVQPWRWGVRPDHMSQILRAYYEAFHLPIVIAENGFATKNGEARADGWTREAYLVAHIKEIQKLKREGVPVIGYMYWTLTDNYEWGSYDPRFGLYRVDVRAGDLTRQETPAVGVYREIIRHGGVSAELSARFPPPTAPQGVSQISK